MLGWQLWLVTSLLLNLNWPISINLCITIWLVVCYLISICPAFLATDGVSPNSALLLPSFYVWLSHLTFCCASGLSAFYLSRRIIHIHSIHKDYLTERTTYSICITLFLFMNDHMVLDNPLMYSSLKKTFSSHTLSIPYLPVVLHAGFSAHRFPFS